MECRVPVMVFVTLLVFCAVHAIMWSLMSRRKLSTFLSCVVVTNVMFHQVSDYYVWHCKCWSYRTEWKMCTGSSLQAVEWRPWGGSMSAGCSMGPIVLAMDSLFMCCIVDWTLARCLVTLWQFLISQLKHIFIMPSVLNEFQVQFRRSHHGKSCTMQWVNATLCHHGADLFFVYIIGICELPTLFFMSILILTNISDK